MSVINEYLAKAVSQGHRFDGRKSDEYREIIVEPGITEGAEGSARVKIGDTEVIAGVKLSLEKPYSDTPEDGNLMVNQELLPLSSPDFEAGPPSDPAVEMARIVDRGIREAKAIDTKALCVEKGEKVWMVSVDIVSVNDAGNLIDASALAAVAALKNARMPKVKDGIINYKELTKEKLPLKADRLPVTVTIHKIGTSLVADPTSEEETASQARLSVAIMQDGNLVALQKGGAGPLSPEEIEKMLELALKKSKELARKVQ